MELGQKKLTVANLSGGSVHLYIVTVKPFGNVQNMEECILVKLDGVCRAGQISGQRTYQAPTATRRRTSCEVYSSEIQ
jgi:hypothetical protein